MNTRRPATAVTLWLLLAFCGLAAADEQHAKEVQDLASLTARLKASDAVTWVFTGDSITHGALHTSGSRSYPEHFAERVRWEMRRFRDVVINTGISGDTTVGLLGDFPWRVGRYDADVVSIMLGMNDCAAGPSGRTAFEANLRKLIELTRSSGAIPLLHTSNTIQGDGRRQDLPAYMQIVRKVALEKDVILVDHTALWLRSDRVKQMLSDKIHPNGLGHRELAKETFRVLQIFDPKSPTCN